jgi:hypothetical protein
MPASYPKPDGQKVNRHAPAFDWTELPAKRGGRTPSLPAWRKWSPSTRAWWRALWTRPQAVMWDQSGATLHVLAALYDDLIGGASDAARVSAEIRQHEDRHGLSPKAMLQLRWRVVADEPKAAREPAGSVAERRKRLRVVS